MARSKTHPQPEAADHLALILVDYDNLVGALTARAPDREQGHRFVLAMLSELRRYLTEELRIRPARTVAYGDFGGGGADTATVLNDLSANGVEVRHVPSTVEQTDCATSLTIHATELLHSRGDLAAFVVLSGNSWYVPLIQHLQRFGKFVLVAALELPSNMHALWGDVADAFLNARFLLDPRSQAALALSDQIIQLMKELFTE